MESAVVAMKVLVTGAEGYIGNVLGPLLLERGHAVTGLDCGFYRDGSLYDEDMAGASDTAGNQIDNAPNSRGEAFGRLRVLFDDVRYYAAHRGSYDSGNARGLATGRDDLRGLSSAAGHRNSEWDALFGVRRAEQRAARAKEIAAKLEGDKLLKSPEAAEAFRAFAERRAPDFSKVA